MKKKRKEPQKRAITVNAMSFEEAFFKDPEYCAKGGGYIKLSDCPEVAACVHVIADMVSNMTIKLMKNTKKGDVRIKNGLSRALDIEPHPLYTRKQFIYWIVKKMLIDGNADVFPVYDSRTDNILRLEPVTGEAHYNSTSEGFELFRYIDGKKLIYSHDELLHFAYNPDINKPWYGQGFRVQLKDILTNLKQAALTKKNYMTDQFKPTVIISVDALTDEFSYEEGRNKIHNQFGLDIANGKPLVVPNDMIKIETVKPLTLNDLAIDASVQMDKKGVAMILGVPLFYLGLAPFNRLEHNNFIDTTIKGVATIIQQVLTKGLLLSPDLYWLMSARSLYSYSINEMGNLGAEMYIKGVMTGNEVRDWIGMPPLEGLDELKILENFILLKDIGNQKKLNNGDNQEST